MKMKCFHFTIGDEVYKYDWPNEKLQLYEINISI